VLTGYRPTGPLHVGHWFGNIENMLRLQEKLKFKMIFTSSSEIYGDYGGVMKEDVLAHLAVSEGGQLGQINRCLAGEKPVPDDFDLTRFNRRSVQKQADKSVADMLREIETAHAQVLELLDKVSEADFDKSGRHARGDILTVEQFFIRTTEHRREHAEQLQRTLASA